MTLNGVIALVLRYFTEFDGFAGQLRHSGWRQTYNVPKILSSSYNHSAKTEPLPLQRGLSAIAELLVILPINSRPRTTLCPLPVVV